MTHYRLEDPPEEIEKEARRLLQEYFNQFSDDDEIPEGGVAEYRYAHASKELKAYLDDIAKLRAEAERDGVMIG